MVASRSWGDDITHILLAGVHMDVDIQENVRLISEPVHRGVQTNPPPFIQDNSKKSSISLVKQLCCNVISSYCWFGIRTLRVWAYDCSVSLKYADRNIPGCCMPRVLFVLGMRIYLWCTAYMDVTPLLKGLRTGLISILIWLSQNLHRFWHLPDLSYW